MKRTLPALLALLLVAGTANAAPPIKPLEGEAAPVTLPQFAGQPRPPAYPVKLARAGVGGVVALRLDIDEAGRLVRASVLDSSGVDALDAAALEGAKSWKFTPAQDATGSPVASSIKVPLTFTAY